MDRNALIRSYFRLGLNYSEIRAFLVLRHNITLSERHLHRILRQNNLWRRSRFSDVLNVCNFLQSEVRCGSSQLHGYRWMHLKCLQNGFVVKQETVRLLLQIIDPEGVDFRKRRRLKRRQYFNKGPNYLWHVDSYDKLKPYGICINGCIDGFSRHIIWLRAAHSNNNPRIIAGYFVDTLNSCGGCPRTLRTDMGTENTYIEQIQTFARSNLQSEHILPPFIYGTSQHNQMIESWWAILRNHNAQFWINFFENLKNTNLFNGTFLDKSLIQFCFMDIIQKELNTVELEWNCHKISSRRNSRAPAGKPITMYNLPELYGTKDYLVPMSNNDVEYVKDICIFVGEIPCDRDVYNLCNVLLSENDYQKPVTPYDARDTYLFLRNKIYSIL